ncbi:MAG: type II toxin-antitoxin system RelE/ParE family toxin [Flavobacteriales bacterium]|nr:type II toxin-antitoxin system RelE/ParE family toxin [Flavobacteriales bacterium]
MSFAVDVSLNFKREAKRLHKRHASLPDDIEQLIGSLEVDPRQGTPIGRNCYKVRLAVRSKGKGKSGGARVITCVVAVREVVYLLAIYDKSEQANLSDGRLGQLLAELGL